MSEETPPIFIPPPPQPVQQAEQYSQFGQDIIISEIFKKKQNGYFVDLGANNGIFFSNTYLLEKNYNWTGICIDGNTNTFQALTDNRVNSICVNKIVCDQTGQTLDFCVVTVDVLCALINYADTAVDYLQADGILIPVETITLTDILDQNNAPTNIDYLSIDTNGAEYQVLQGIDFNKYTFGVLTVEHSNISQKQTNIRDFLATKGYILYKELFTDDIFINSNLII